MMRARILGISFRRKFFLGLILVILIIFFAVNIPTRNMFIQLKKWWYMNIVLDGSVYISENSELNEHIILSRVRELPDFEYSYPNPYSYALIWVSTNEIEVCSSLTSMLKMQSYFKDSSLPLSYVLLSSMDMDSSVIKERWESSRGKFIHVSANKLKWTDKTSGLRHYATQLSFTWISLIDSKGIPLMKLKNTIQEIFLKRHLLTTNSLIVGYPLFPMNQELYEDVSQEWTKNCYDGKPSPLVDTHLLFLQPSKFIFNRLTLYEDTNMDFHQAINTEFHCNHETHVLEFNSSLRDVDLLHGKEMNATKLEFIYFGFPVVPWNSLYETKILPKLSQDANLIIRSWIDSLFYICDDVF